MALPVLSRAGKPSGALFMTCRALRFFALRAVFFLTLGLSLAAGSDPVPDPFVPLETLIEQGLRFWGI